MSVREGILAQDGMRKVVELNGWLFGRLQDISMSLYALTMKYEASEHAAHRHISTDPRMSETDTSDGGQRPHGTPFHCVCQ